MKGLILAAGFGKRLRPITLKKPKALVPVLNLPMIERNIHFLKSHGINEIIINTHYMHEQIEEYISKNDFGIPIHTVFEPRILGTGGAIRNVSNLWKNEPLLVINGDVITDIDISRAYEWHLKNKALATLILHHYPRFKKIDIDIAHHITRIKKKEESGCLSFTGIHILDPDIINFMPYRAFDIVDFYREMIRKEFFIKGYVSYGHYWRDIGTIEDYIKANREALKGSSVFLHKTSAIHPSAKFTGWAIVGKNCVIEEYSCISRSILWENTIIGKGIKVTDSIVTGGKIREDLKNIVA